MQETIFEASFSELWVGNGFAFVLHILKPHRVTLNKYNR